MAVLLKNSAEKGRVQFRILDKDRHHYWNLLLHAKGCSVRPVKVNKPDLEIVTTVETWRQMAGGKLSPLIAFVRGKMRVRGDEKLGKRLLKELASSEGKTDIC
jgi:putative sterol carrier protein